VGTISSAHGKASHKHAPVAWAFSLRAAPPEASDPSWLVQFLASLAREDLSPAKLRMGAINPVTETQIAAASR
jgi:hypothetical protein